MDNDGAYGLGEGIGGAMATASASTHFSVSADAGGYALPVASPGKSIVEFTFGDQSLGIVNITASETDNVKADLALPYSAPIVTGPAVASLNQQTVYDFTPVAGASAYEVQIAQIDNSAWSEGAEIGTTTKIIDSTSSAYSLFSSTNSASGSRAFWMTFPDWEDQEFELDRNVLLSDTSKLEFDSRFRWVTDKSTLYAELSTDEGKSWQVVWQRSGTNDSGDFSYSHHSIPLSSLAGETARVRFRFRHHNSAFHGTVDYVGIYLDNITVTDTTELTSPEITQVAGAANGFSLQPENSGQLRLAVRPLVPEPLPYGEPLLIQAQSLPSVAIEKTEPGDNGDVSVTFLVENGAFNTMSLELSSDTHQGWETDKSASLVNLGGGRYRFDTTSAADVPYRFFRVTGTVD